MLLSLLWLIMMMMGSADNVLVISGVFSMKKPKGNVKQRMKAVAEGKADYGLGAAVLQVYAAYAA